MTGRVSLLRLAVMLFTLISLATSAGAVCADYENYFHPLYSGAVGNSPDDMARSGDILYFVGDTGEFVIIDISDPSSAQRLGSCYQGDPVYAVAVDGPLATALVQWDLVQLIDVANPEFPGLLGSCLMDARPRRVAMSGNYAYVTAWTYGESNHGIYIVDLTDPMAPLVLDRVMVNNYPGEIVVSAGHAYVIDNSAMQILDLSTPQMPVVIGSCPIPGDSRYLTVRGDYVYVVAQAEEYPAYNDGLFIINASDPTQPWVEGELVGTESIPNGPITLWGDYALLGYNGGCAFVDISDPAAPELSWHTAGFNYPREMTTDGDILWSLGYGMLSSAALSESFTPPAVAEIPGTEGLWSMKARGNYCYAVQYLTNSLLVFDMSDPLNPILCGSEEMGFDSVGGLSLNSDTAKTPLAFVTGSSDEDGFSIVDISNPTDPTLLGTIELPIDSRDFDIEGNYLYMPARHGEVEIYDISNPFSPVYVDSMEFTYSIRFTEVEGDRLYIGRTTYLHPALWIYDVSDPRHPVYLGETTSLRGPWEIAIREPFVYVADFEGGLRILDVSDPTDIQEASHVQTVRHAQSLQVVGDYLYVADATNMAGIQVINISNPYAPQVVGYCQVNHPIELVHVNGHLIAGCNSDPATVLPLMCEASAAEGPWTLAREPISMVVQGNPVPGSCGLKLSLQEQLPVELSIHDIQGRLVRRLHEGAMSVGDHDLRWDGLDETGNRATTGAYFVRLRYEETEVSHRLILIR
jgi:hypothetical protein